MPRSGNLRERALFERLTDADGLPDSMGNVGDAWTPLFYRRVDMLTQPGREAVSGGAQADVVNATMRLRADPETCALTGADRVTVRGHVWNIRSIEQIGRSQRRLELRITRGVAT